MPHRSMESQQSLRHQRQLAAVDLGSSSFRMIIGRVEEVAGTSQIYLVDSLRDPVRLGAGLQADDRLDHASQQRAIAALGRFGERLRSFDPRNVRAVATNAVRVAQNATEFLKKAERALGFPIEVISGHEEARLIYVGVAHLLPQQDGKRLVIDVGGGSTEFIIGQHHDPIALESLAIGCVSASERFFPGGNVTSKSMKEAVMACRETTAFLLGEFVNVGWQHVIGSSGTARAIAELISQNGWSKNGIARAGLDALRATLVRHGNVNALKLQGLRPDRIPVLAGGVAVMSGIFEELNLDHMFVTDGGLRQGVLYDLLGRQQAHDMREVTVAQFAQRYHVDRQQAARVKELCLRTFRALRDELQVQHPFDAISLEHTEQMIGWAAELHEIGLSISHNGYHKHSAYMLKNADMPGFSKPEQEFIATAVLMHNGKLGRPQDQSLDKLQTLAVLSLRLATLLLRRRTPDGIPPFNVELHLKKRTVYLHIPQAWLQEHSLTAYSLEQDAEEWAKHGWQLVHGKHS